MKLKWIKVSFIQEYQIKNISKKQTDSFMKRCKKILVLLTHLKNNIPVLWMGLNLGLEVLILEELQSQS
ncbi:hypothetical protein A9R12_17465 [Aeromonas hydrophila]|nr:hypothetical protein A9R12_17465 [Aeromonas hydrophila]